MCKALVVYIQSSVFHLSCILRGYDAPAYHFTVGNIPKMVANEVEQKKYRQHTSDLPKERHYFIPMECHNHLK